MTRICRRTYVVVALAVLAVGASTSSGLAVIGPTSGQSADSQAADTPRFLDAPYSEHRGDVVRIPVALPNGSAATLSIESEATDYAANLTLHDRNGDGRVTLVWNTHASAATRGVGGFRASAPADAVTNRTVDGPVPAGEYALSVGPVGGDAIDGTALDLTRPGPVDVSVLGAANGSAGELTNPADFVNPAATPILSTARSYGTGRLEVLRGEVLVLELRVPGLAGAFAAAPGPNATARFRTLLGDALAVSAEEAITTVSQSERPVAFDLRNVSRFRVVSDPATDTYYVVLGTPRAFAGHGGPHARSAVELGDRLHVEVRAQAARGTPAAANATVEFVERDTVLDTGPGSRLSPAPNGTLRVTGRTRLRSGERLVVRANGSSGAVEPVSRRAVVGPDGRFSATFDLSGVPAGTRFAVAVLADGRTADVALGVVGRVASVWFDGRSGLEHPVRSVTLAAVETTHGGFVAVHRGGADGRVVGASRYLPPGKHARVVVPLRRPVVPNATLVAVAYRDGDGDGAFDDTDPAYPNGTPTAVARFTARGEVTVATATPTAATTPAPGATRSIPETPPSTSQSSPSTGTPGRPTASRTRTASATRTGGDGTVPGFVGSLAVLALVAAGLLVARRR